MLDKAHRLRFCEPVFYMRSFPKNGCKLGFERLEMRRLELLVVHLPE